MLHRIGWKWLSYSFVFTSLLAGSTPARAQCQYWAAGFEPNGTDFEVGAMTVFTDGFSPRALYAAGHGGVVRWDEASAAWSSFGQPNGDCAALIGFDDGFGRALFLAGSFNQVDGSPNLVNYIAKWNGAGWSDLAGGMNFFVHALAVFDDGSGGGPALYAGGDFATAGGVFVHSVAKWDGTNWSALGSGVLQNGSTGSVRALAVFDDGLGGGPALYAGGHFDDASGVPVNNVAKWDGANWSALGTGIGGQAAIALALAVHDDGTGGGPALYAGGSFSFAGGTSAEGVAKWDGASWSALGGGVSGLVRQLASFDDDSGSGPQLYAAGFFDTAGGVLSPRIARWNGASWNKVGRGTDGDVFALTAHRDDAGQQLYVGGTLARAGNLHARHIAKWDGSQWSALGGQGLGQGFPEVWAMKAFDDGSGDGLELYVGGQFISAGSLSVENLAKWSGTSWSPVGSGMNDRVYALEIFDDGLGAGPALYAGGAFITAGGTAANGVAAWDGSSWRALGTGISGTAKALAVYDDELGGGAALYAAGGFFDAGGVSANRIAKWDGASWTALGSGLDGFVRTLAVYDDGLGGGPMLIAGGDFDTAGGVSASRIARWDGTTWRPLGSGVAGVPLSKVHALAVFDDGLGGGPALYAGGESSFGSTACKIARWNGTTWSPVCSFMEGYAYALGVFDDGTGRGNRLYAAGAFTGLDGATAGCIARFDGSIWTPVGYGLDNATTALGAFDDGSGAGPDLYAGGYFYHADFHPASSIARFVGCDAPGQAVCFGDGSVVPCPCGNDGGAGHGCENSHATGGAQITTAGWTSLAHDTLVLTSSGEGSNALSIFLEGGDPGPPVHFGDGLLCAGAPLTRLYTKVASGGTVSAPQPGDASISARSIASGIALTSGVSRSYQVYYRDADLSFCPAPNGDGWNVSSGMRIGWAP